MTYLKTHYWYTFQSARNIFCRNANRFPLHWSPKQCFENNLKLTYSTSTCWDEIFHRQPKPKLHNKENLHAKFDLLYKQDSGLSQSWTMHFKLLLSRIHSVDHKMSTVSVWEKSRPFTDIFLQGSALKKSPSRPIQGIQTHWSSLNLSIRSWYPLVEERLLFITTNSSSNWAKLRIMLQQGARRRISGQSCAWLVSTFLRFTVATSSPFFAQSTN